MLACAFISAAVSVDAQAPQRPLQWHLFARQTNRPRRAMRAFTVRVGLARYSDCCCFGAADSVSLLIAWVLSADVLMQ